MRRRKKFWMAAAPSKGVASLGRPEVGETAGIAVAEPEALASTASRPAVEMAPEPVSRPDGLITMTTLAKELDLSVATVSQALNPRSGTIKLRPETIERVREHARSRNYRPHAGARSIRSKRFENIGYLILKPVHDAYEFQGFQEGMSDAAQLVDYNMIDVRVPHGRPGNPATVFKVFRVNSIDALIVGNMSGLSDELARAIEESFVPVVFLHHPRKHNAVWVDDVLGARLATRHLLERGVRKVALLTPGILFPSYLPHYSLIDRETGYRQEMEEAGLQPEVIVAPYPNPERIEAIFDDPKGARAFVCYSDVMANHVMRIAYSRGLRCPEDFLVVGFNDEYMARQSVVPLTSVTIPFNGMGRAAFEMAHQLVDNNSLSIPGVKFEPRLTVRRSSGE